MKQKNTIFFIIDSVYYDKILKNDYRNCPMPFINKIMKKGLSTTNMFSEAPYTEAALTSILGGTDTLKRGGYLKRLKDKESIMEVFKENGYNTYFNGYQPLIYPSGAYTGVTDKFYNLPYDFSAVWNYRLYFYSDLYKNNKLEDKCYPLVNEILEDNFLEWINCFEKMKNKDKEMSLIEHLYDIKDLDVEKEKLENEYSLYLKNKDKYLKQLLSEGTNHNLFKIKTYTLDRGNTLEFRKKLYKKEINTFRKIYYLNAKKNLLNNKLVIKDLFKDFNLFIQYLKMYKAAVMDKDLFSKIDYNTKSVKASPSMYTYINHFLKWYKEKDNNKPFFAYIHTEECHSPEIFFSHDSNDEERLEFEFSKIKEFISQLPKKYKGNLAYDLSLLYTDLCIEYLYKKLEKDDMLDKTNIVICADHGSSYTYDPMHENYVRNEYYENYKIPFLIVGKDIKYKVVKKYCNSKDIPATVLDACNLKIPKSYDGKSLFKYDGNDYVIIQNINGGCPDYNYRKVWLGIKNDNYSVTMEFDMNKEFKDGCLYSVFDMNADKTERNNLKNKLNIEIEIEKEIKIIKNCFMELKNDIKKNNFLKSGDSDGKN